MNFHLLLITINMRSGWSCSRPALFKVCVAALYKFAKALTRSQCHICHTCHKTDWPGTRPTGRETTVAGNATNGPGTRPTGRERTHIRVHPLVGPRAPPRPPRSCEGAATPSRSPPPPTCGMRHPSHLLDASPRSRKLHKKTPKNFHRFFTFPTFQLFQASGPSPIRET